MRREAAHQGRMSYEDEGRDGSGMSMFARNHQKLVEGQTPDFTQSLRKKVAL
jgi:hypothetical protein